MPEAPELASCCLHWLAHPRAPGKGVKKNIWPYHWMSDIFAYTICTVLETFISEAGAKAGNGDKAGANTS